MKEHTELKLELIVGSSSENLRCVFNLQYDDDGQRVCS